MITDIIVFCSERDRSLLEMRAKFPAAAGRIGDCLKKDYLTVDTGLYAATTAGLELVEAEKAEHVRDQKRCPGCMRSLPSAEFWRARNQADGLFPYCIECAKRLKQLKRQQMEQQQAAVAEIVAAGKRIAEAAKLWDTGVLALAQAWDEIVKANEIMRVNRQILRIDLDNGRMEARLIHPRAAFALGMALADKGYPIGYSVLREAGMPAKLATFVGDAPHEDYVGRPDEVKPVAKQKDRKPLKSRRK